MNDDHDDRELFRRRMGDVRPLNTEKTAPVRPRPAPKARFTRADNEAVLRESLSDTASPDAHAELTYARPGLSKAVIRKLRRGQYSIADELDLHGLSATEARSVLDQFLAESVERGHSCVRVIHGKGTRSGHRGPVLKPKVARWLRRRDGVLAYTTARPVDGGSGALYVLLKVN